MIKLGPVKTWSILENGIMVKKDQTIRPDLRLYGVTVSYLAYLDYKQQTKSGPELLAKCGIKGSWRIVLLDWLHDIIQKKV